MLAPTAAGRLVTQYSTLALGCRRSAFEIRPFAARRARGPAREAPARSGGHRVSPSTLRATSPSTAIPSASSGRREPRRERRARSPRPLRLALPTSHDGPRAGCRGRRRGPGIPSEDWTASSSASTVRLSARGLRSGRVRLAIARWIVDPGGGGDYRAERREPHGTASFSPSAAPSVLPTWPFCPYRRRASVNRRRRLLRTCREAAPRPPIPREVPGELLMSSWRTA